MYPRGKLIFSQNERIYAGQSGKEKDKRCLKVKNCKKDVIITIL